jgi:hypothetical protein
MKSKRNRTKIKMKVINSEIDAVKMMRLIRQKISSETKDMNFDQFSKFISKKLHKNN